MAQMKNRSRKPMAEINVVPYIDVMLVLLVIFMITTPLLTQGVQINLPQAQSKVIDASNDEPIIVSVDPKGRYYLNIANKPNAVITPHGLATRIAAEIALARQTRRSPPTVLVKGDTAAHYGLVVQAMVLLQKAGVAQVGLMTESLPSSTARTSRHARKTNPRRLANHRVKRSALQIPRTSRRRGHG